MAKLCEQYRIGIKGFAPEFLDGLMIYEWPGNVRELISTMEKAISEAFNEPTLYSKHLPVNIRVGLKKTELTKKHPPEANSRNGFQSVESLPTLGEYREKTISDTERRYLTNLIEITAGNIKEACRVSGLSRPRLYALLKKYNMTKQSA
jgi:two-component system NtrC family response regulator